MKDKKRYSEAFKLKVMEELRDGKWKTVSGAPPGTPASPCGTAQQGRESRPVVKQHNSTTKCQL